jgi:transcriptional regulator with XRE-family HTH domain
VVSDSAPDDAEQADLPEQWITASQLVAHNMAAYRQAEGMTQEELGQRLGKWSGPSVSAAERSWAGKRVKKFDADELVALSSALSVPLIALFLPPADDGIRVRYRLRIAEDAPDSSWDMGDLFGLAVMPDSDDHAPAMLAYRARLMAAVSRYLDKAWAGEVARWLSKADSPALRADRIARLWARHSELLQTADELKALAGALEDVADGEDGS